jgi:hypothetical protein
MINHFEVQHGNSDDSQGSAQGILDQFRVRLLKGNSTTRLSDRV